MPPASLCTEEKSAEANANPARVYNQLATNWVLAIASAGWLPYGAAAAAAPQTWAR